ncbi:MAG: TolC family protein [Bacteroidales bacterium]|nr:TolC family protein [Bacteroidales bacterium]
MRRKTLFIAFICVYLVMTLGPVDNSWAQESSKVMSLKDCMEYAISNSTKTRIQQAASGDARIARRDAILQAFTPNLSGSTYAYYNFGRSIDPQTNTYFTQTSFHNSYSVSAGFDLFNGFQAVNNLKISKTGLAISESQEKQVEADICLAVMEAYYNVVYYKRLADIYEEQVGAAEMALKKAVRQEELGQKGHADVVQMEADLADRKYDLTNVRNSYKDQLMTLGDLMFWPPEEELVVDTNVRSFAPARSFADAQDDNSVILREQKATEESVIAFALENNPQIKIAEGTMLNAKRELSTTKGQLLPSLGLYAGWSTTYYTYQGAQTNPFRDQFRNNGGEYVEMSMSIPIWGKLQKQSRIAKQRNALTKATAEYDQKRRDVESEVRRAIQDRDGSEAAYDQARYKSEVQEEAYNLNLKKMEQGLISPLELQTATNNYLKSKADEMNSLYKYLIKDAVVKYFGGIEYINQ